VTDKRIQIDVNVVPYLSDAIVIADRFYLSDLFLLAAVAPSSLRYYTSEVKAECMLPDICVIASVSADVALDRLAKDRRTRRFLDQEGAVRAAESVIDSSLAREISPKLLRLPNDRPECLDRCVDSILTQLKFFPS
jgi:thymidylate kinase